MDVKLLSSAEQTAFFQNVLSRADEAEAKSGTLAQTIEIGGTTVRFIFAGERLFSTLGPALSHLRIDEDLAPQLTVHVFESADSGIELPPAPCPSALFSDRGELWTLHGGSLRSAYHALEGSLSLLDVDTATAVYWVRSADQIPYWVSAAPFRGLLNWWMEANGGQLLHAAAVGIDGRAVLITGKGGTGKSSTSLACLEAGLGFAGDDYVVVTGGDEPKVWSLYRTAKIGEADMERFARFRPELQRFGEDSKAVIFLDEASPQLKRCMPLAAVVTPEFADKDETSVVPATRVRVRNAALFTTLCQLPHVGQNSLEFIDELLDRVPAGILQLGKVREAVPAALIDLLEKPELPLGERPTPAGTALPLVSVVIPVHNGARFLREAVDSILEQNYPAVDIVVVDDGSLDDIVDAVDALPADVRFMRQLNAGPAAARNRGIVNAAGDVIAFLDVDDLWPEGSLRASVEALLQDEATDVVIGHGQQRILDQETGSWADVGDPGASFPYSIPAAVFRRPVFRTVGLFDEDLRFGEDTDWFLRAQDHGAIVKRLDRTTLIVRRHGSNMTEGRAGFELVPLRLFKNVRDRRRQTPD